jgi:RHS repeat-associated protein
MDITTEEVENNFRFPGQYYDQEAGLHYNYHRYYYPKTGRYITPDPICFAEGINLYAYVQNTPISWIDPLGLKAFEMTIWIGGGVGHFIVGGGLYNVTITDLENGKSTLYTMKVFGVGVGLPSFRGSSRAIKFEADDCRTSDSFDGFGYIGGLSAEVTVGVKVGGGIKIPNGPFIPGSNIDWDRGGVDIGVSHNITYWSH